MTPETITTFFGGYLQSLAEETRKEKSGLKIGFDHVVLQLMQADNFVPIRIAYHRGGRDSFPRPKKEAEHGEDLKCLSKDGTILVVFVLKDEPLTYKNWRKCGFHDDMARASEQDLTIVSLRKVKHVKVILVYNKDDEEEGVEEYDRFVKSRGEKLGKRAKLSFERWNLTELTIRVKAKLLASPALLPEHLFRPFSYICWQVADFTHGSDHWREILISDWKEFLGRILDASLHERSIRMVAVALIVLRSHGKSEPSFETGWIELIEWAIIAIWKAAAGSKSAKIKNAAVSIWSNFYIVGLHEFYKRNALLVSAEHGLSTSVPGEFGEAVSVYHTYWHMGRLGLLAQALIELCNVSTGEVEKGRIEAFFTTASLLVKVVEANPASRRPLLDIHHIELFLFWRTMRFAQKPELALSFFKDLHERLLLRRLRNRCIPLIDQSNSWASVFEFIATREAPSEAYGRSSFLLQMVLEICAADFGAAGQELANAIHLHLIEGKRDDGTTFDFPEKVELQSWVPPEDWWNKVLGDYVGHEGGCVTVNSYFDPSEKDHSTLPKRVSNFVRRMREAHPFQESVGVPVSVLFLACILHESPLPPEYWRCSLYQAEEIGTTKGKSKAKTLKRNK